MKFELKPFHKDIQDNDLLDDLKKVANEMSSEYLEMRFYDKHGLYHSGTIARKFGSWNTALEKAGLKISKYSSVSDKELLDNLKTVAQEVAPKKVTQKLYSDKGKFSVQTIHERFGWNNALKLLGLQVSLNTKISDNELFKNLENVWVDLGQQPGKRAMNTSISIYSERPYINRFGTWSQALQAFVDFINSENRNNENTVPEQEKVEEEIQRVKTKITHKTKRDINARLKVKVLIRDGNTCRLCGVKVVRENTHFDHKKPWAKGGETVFENIQVLCSKCNLAKGDYYPNENE